MAGKVAKRLLRKKDMGKDVGSVLVQGLGMFQNDAEVLSCDGHDEERELGVVWLVKIVILLCLTGGKKMMSCKLRLGSTWR